MSTGTRQDRREALIGQTIQPPIRRSATVRTMPITILVSILLSSCVHSDLAPGVSPEAIRSLRLGMTMDDVWATIGAPYSVQAHLGIHQGNCSVRSNSLDREVSNESEVIWLVDSTFRSKVCCQGNRRQKSERRFSLVYSRMVSDHGISPMLWLHFNVDGLLCSIGASVNSRVAWRDDEGVYLQRLDDERYEADGTIVAKYAHCDDELLEKYFRQ